MAVVEVLLRVAGLVGEPLGPRLDRLVFAAVIHDVGKLDADFQAMLEAASRNLPRPARLVKHEACTYEQAEDGSVHPRVRRQWTCSAQGEVRRITFVDLLVEYFPLGGFVMIGDLIASYCHEQEKDYAEVFGQARTLAELIELVTRYAPEIEASLKQDDPRDYGLAELLKLLAGGIR